MRREGRGLGERVLRNRSVKNKVRGGALVAIPTDDGETIFPGMLGRAQQFYIFEVESVESIKLKEKRANPYAKTIQHLKTLDVYEILRDCNWVISARIGKRGIDRLRERGLKLVFQNGKIEDTLRTFLDEEINRT